MKWCVMSFQIEMFDLLLTGTPKLQSNQVRYAWQIRFSIIELQ